MDLEKHDKTSAMTEEKIEVSVVVPVFNEELVIEEFFHRMTQTLKKARVNYEFVFVDDGSFDGSYELLKKCKKEDPPRVRLLRLARNFGHQLAITAGLRAAQGKAVVVVDCDLQDPPEMVLEFIRKWKEGYSVVYGIRTERKGETFFKRITARMFYKLIRLLTTIDIPENAGDFYLLDRVVVDILNRMEERHRFIRGLIVWVGFKRIGIGYSRAPRFAGRTKYGLWRMIKFAFDAATSFSFAPLRGILFLGSVICVLAFVGILVIIYLKLFTDRTVVGWTSLMAVVLFMGGIQLLAIGLIGEYIARIGDDVKDRPLYTIQEFL